MLANKVAFPPKPDLQRFSNHIRVMHVNFWRSELQTVSSACWRKKISRRDWSGRRVLRFRSPFNTGRRCPGDPRDGEKGRAVVPLQIRYTVGREGRDQAAGELIIKSWDDRQVQLL